VSNNITSLESRRVARVDFDPRMLVHLFTGGRAWRCRKGVPATAKFLGIYQSPQHIALSVGFEHESFDPVLISREATPIDVEFENLNSYPANDAEGARAALMNYGVGEQISMRVELQAKNLLVLHRIGVGGGEVSVSAKTCESMLRAMGYLVAQIVIEEAARAGRT
jgi:hypothetical protein